MSADPRLDAVTGSGQFFDLPVVLRAGVSGAYLGAYYVLAHLALGHTALWGSSMAMRREAWLAVRSRVSRRRPGGARRPRPRVRPRTRAADPVRPGRCGWGCPPGPCVGTPSGSAGSTVRGAPCASTGGLRRRGTGGGHGWRAERQPVEDAVRVEDVVGEGRALDEPGALVQAAGGRRSSPRCRSPGARCGCPGRPRRRARARASRRRPPARGPRSWSASTSARCPPVRAP